MKRADEGTMTLKCKWPHHMKDNNKEKGSFIPSPSFFKEIETILQLRIVTERSLNNVSTAGGWRVFTQSQSYLHKQRINKLLLPPLKFFSDMLELWETWPARQISSWSSCWLHSSMAGTTANDATGRVPILSRSPSGTKRGRKPVEIQWRKSSSWRCE